MGIKFCLDNYKKIHFVGIGGVSMSGLAKYVLSKNKTVSGSDLTKNTATDELQSLGATIYSGHNKSNVDGVGAVVFTSAISNCNLEIKEANDKNIAVFERSQVLGDIMQLYSNSVAVAGSHGKTTATAMISDILLEGKKDPTVFIGGDYENISRFRSGDSNIVIAEACEYKKNLLKIHPKIAVILNLDNDHMDSYKNMTDMTNTFKEFAKQSIAVLNADDLYSDALFNSSTVTFGIDRPATYTAKSIKYNGKGYTFTLCINYHRSVRIKLKVFGWHNIYNALSACAVADLFKVSPLTMKRALENFTGVKRRNEFLGDIDGIKYFADYAHHPREILSTLNAYDQNGEKFFTVFQPHTYSRTKLLMEDFIEVFNSRQDVLIYDTYPAREEYEAEGSAKKLYENLKDSDLECEYAENKGELYKKLDGIGKNFKKVLFLGAGDVYDIAREYLSIKSTLKK